MKKLLKFIKFQFLRGFNFIKIFWDAIFSLTDDSNLTLFGKYLINVLLFVFFTFVLTVLVIFTLIVLCVFKYDEEVGF